MTADTLYKLYRDKFDTIIVGSGASGFNAANRLFERGVKNIAIVTEDINIGTSRNAGSDKQTYYKLALESSDLDSVDKMAKVYVDGLQMHGDIAKVEASESVRAFMNLVELGVEFPFNDYGEYIAYKTDHDPNKRATSAGPYTSKQMTEKLEKRASEYGIKILNHYKVVRVFTSNNTFDAILCLHKDSFYLIEANNIIYATGGPANIYANKVYPNGQKGASGFAFEAGIKGMNLTHFQYGMSSLNPKWNVSGTYMQAMPRFYSIDQEGKEHDFLAEHYEDFNELLKNIFLKGYQWPFDVRKIKGSSLIDYLVYKEEIFKKRRVFIDFRENPSFEGIEFNQLDDEAREYILKNKADLPKPIDRLIKMNKKAYDFYLDHGVDLKKQSLEISICAQHNNGGLYIDKDYETNIKGFYTVGEAAGSHGIYRPGGSALNAGQVGSKRASEKISLTRRTTPIKDHYKEASDFIDKFYKLISNESNIHELIREAQAEMTASAAAFRNIKEIKELILKRRNAYNNFYKIVKINKNELIKAFEYYEIIISQLVYLEAMLDYYKKIDAKIGGSTYFEDNIDFDSEGKFVNEIQTVEFDGDKCKFDWEKTREIPSNNNPFEVQWNDYLDKRRVL